jgi:ubiquitin-protein ligase
MASSIASRRLFHEYKLLTSNPPDGITAGPVSEDDIFLWEALIQGPDGTPFEGGIFPAELKFPKDYPLNPPTMRFLSEVWHPNGMCSVYGWGREMMMWANIWLGGGSLPNGSRVYIDPARTRR